MGAKLFSAEGGVETINMKPMLFNTDMVRAILEGRKTVTRRVVKPQPINPRWHQIDWIVWDDGHGYEVRQPYRPDDILYVRETFFEYAGEYVYKASAAQPELWNGMWRPSIHMPREAARIFLRVTDVKAERLQDIDDEGAKAESANWRNGKNVGVEEKMRRSARERFAELWNSTIKPADRALYGWDANPYVWRVEFERISKEEAMKGA